MKQLSGHNMMEAKANLGTSQLFALQANNRTILPCTSKIANTAYI